MSLLPFAPSNATAPRDRAANATDRVADVRLAARPRAMTRPPRPERVERTPRNERDDQLPGNERAARAATPPDFAALMALLAVTSVREAQAQRVALGTAADAASAEAFDAETQIEERAASTLQTLTAEQRANDRDATRAALDESMDPPRTLATLAAERARAVLAALDADAAREGVPRNSAFSAGALAANALGASSTNDPSTAALAALAERVRTGNAGELLARGDRTAATVRDALDALLDTAGTTRGRALAESTRPGFADAVTRSASDVTTAVRDPDALAPAFRARVDRVIDRMRDEFGHDVQIVETVRSAERQEHLYAQGRTRPGPVVTWTLDSAHRSGEAADVIIDGQWHNPQGYTRLHVIAQEEGLRTLGMRDPGHLELRGSATHGEDAVATATARANMNAAETARASTMTGTAGVAAVARVASVARVAQVAQVARVGSGSARVDDRVARDAAAPSSPSLDPMPTGSGRTAAVASASTRSHDHQGGGAARDGRERDSQSSRTSVADTMSAVGALSPTAARVLEGDTLKSAVPIGTDSAARAEAIAVLREDAPLRPLSSLTMQLDSPDGPEQVRVTMRGGVVDTQVTTTNGALADRLRLQTADLQDALGRHGLDTDTVRVQQPARTSENDAVRQALSDRGEVLRAAGASAGQQGGTFEQSPRDRPPARSQAERDPRQADDDPHQQRRRENRQEQR